MYLHPSQEAVPIWLHPTKFCHDHSLYHRSLAIEHTNRGVFPINGALSISKDIVSSVDLLLGTSAGWGCTFVAHGSRLFVM